MIMKPQMLFSELEPLEVMLNVSEEIIVGIIYQIMLKMKYQVLMVETQNIQNMIHGIGNIMLQLSLL